MKTQKKVEATTEVKRKRGRPRKQTLPETSPISKKDLIKDIQEAIKKDFLPHIKELAKCAYVYSYAAASDSCLKIGDGIHSSIVEMELTAGALLSDELEGSEFRVRFSRFIRTITIFCSIDEIFCQTNPPEPKTIIDAWMRQERGDVLADYAVLLASLKESFKSLMYYSIVSIFSILDFEGAQSPAINKVLTRDYPYPYEYQLEEDPHKALSEHRAILEEAIKQDRRDIETILTHPQRADQIELEDMFYGIRDSLTEELNVKNRLRPMITQLADHGVLVSSSDNVVAAAKVLEKIYTVFELAKKEDKRLRKREK